MSAVTRPLCHSLIPSQDTLAEERQTLLPGHMEATACAGSVISGEVEETVDSTTSEVISLSIAIVDFSFTFWIEHSAGEILLVFTYHMTGINDRTSFPVWNPEVRGSSRSSHRQGGRMYLQSLGSVLNLIVILLELAIP